MWAYREFIAGRPARRGRRLGGLLVHRGPDQPAAFFLMLKSRSSKVAVINIDNGFCAGYMALMINRAR